MWGLCNMIFYVPHGAMFMTKCMVGFNKYMLKWIELMFRDFHPRKQSSTAKTSLQRERNPNTFSIMAPCNSFKVSPHLSMGPVLFISPGLLLPTAHFSQRKTAVFGFKFPSGKFILFILRGQRKEFCIRSFPWGNRNKKTLSSHFLLG